MEVTQNEENFSEKTGNSDVINLLKRMQEQMTFLERKIDHLTKAVEHKEPKESYGSKFSKEPKRSQYGSKERKFSRGKHKGEESQGDSGFVKEKRTSFGKPFGKSFGKTFKKKDERKKKDFSFKKTFGKFKAKKEKKEE